MTSESTASNSNPVEEVNRFEKPPSKMVQLLRRIRCNREFLSRLLDDSTPGQELLCLRERILALEKLVKDFLEIEARRHAVLLALQALAQKAEHLKEKEKRLEERSAALAPEEKKLAEQRKELDRRESKIASREKSLQEFDNHLTERETEVRRLHAEMALWERANEMHRLEEREIQQYRDRQLRSLLRYVESVILCLALPPEYEPSCVSAEEAADYIPDTEPPVTDGWDPSLDVMTEDERRLFEHEEEYEQQEFDDELDGWMDYADEALLGDEADEALLGDEMDCDDLVEGDDDDP